MYNLNEQAFLEVADDHTVIPIIKELACDFVTPVGFFSKVQTEHSFILESVESSERIGRYSFVGLSPKYVIYTLNNQTVIRDGEDEQRIETGDPFTILKETLAKYKPVGFQAEHGYLGGAVGYLSYDMIAFVEKLSLSNPDDLQLPDMYFIIPKTVVVFDHFNRTIKLVFNAFIEEKDQATDLFHLGIEKLEEIEQHFHEPIDLPLLNMENHTTEPSFSSNITPDSFYKSVNQAKQYIQEGEAIQVVVSQRFEMPYTGDSLSLYRSLRMINPSPYMFLINFSGFSLVGASPEVMVKEERKNVTIRPIAGTRKRTGNEDTDLEAERSLLADTKERAEHVMLVDLARNDIGRVCESGSVKVDELMVIERYSHVMHIVSNVTGTLSNDHDAFDLIKATFPAGTLSGAPKVRAMEIIEELEQSKRGPYGGAVCYFALGGNFDSCITIRTVILKENKAYIQAGAGVVYDSVDEKEYEETVSKAKGMFKAIQMAAGLQGEAQ